MRYQTPLVAAAVASALALAACGTAASTSTLRPPPSQAASTSAPAGPAAITNPVTIVRETRATITPGEVYGSSTAQGWLDADGSFASGERIDVYTLPAGLTGQQAVAQVGVTSSDSQTLIAGGNFYMFVYPAQDLSTGGTTYPVSLSTIAARVHGTVIEPSS